LVQNAAYDGCGVVIVVVTTNVAAVVGHVFPRLCPSLCQVSMGWWTEGKPYSVSCWTLSHWLSVVTIVPGSLSGYNVAAYPLIKLYLLYRIFYVRVVTVEDEF
jgi:hypothetical protein